MFRAQAPVIGLATVTSLPSVTSPAGAVTQARSAPPEPDPTHAQSPGSSSLPPARPLPTHATDLRVSHAADRASVTRLSTIRNSGCSPQKPLDLREDRLQVFRDLGRHRRSVVPAWLRWEVVEVTAGAQLDGQCQKPGRHVPASSPRARRCARRLRSRRARRPGHVLLGLSLSLLLSGQGAGFDDIDLGDGGISFQGLLLDGVPDAARPRIMRPSRSLAGRVLRVPPGKGLPDLQGPDPYESATDLRTAACRRSVSHPPSAPR